MPSFPTLWKWIFSGSDAGAWTFRGSSAPSARPDGRRIWTHSPNWKRCWRSAERKRPRALEGLAEVEALPDGV